MTKRLISQLRSPVRREGAELNILLTLLSFAASVAATRLFLELTGYPRLGNAVLHFAHVLWGGLFLFAAALLPLIFANRWVYPVGALTAGLGVGLFIDEVGKFITLSNDYFYPAAAPIIYAFFLLTVLLFLHIRRPPARDPRAELYRVFESLQEVLDRDLDEGEHAVLVQRLKQIAQQADDPDISALTEELLHFLDSEAVHLVPNKLSLLERLQRWVEGLQERIFSPRRLRAALVGGLAALGVVQLLDVLRLLLLIGDLPRLEEVLTALINGVPVASQSGLWWFATRLALEGTVGLMLILGALLLVLRRDPSGSLLAYFGLLLSLAVVNLLVFFFEQFSTIIPATIQFILLLGVLLFRRRLSSAQASGAQPAPESEAG